MLYCPLPFTISHTVCYWFHPFTQEDIPVTSVYFKFTSDCNISYLDLLFAKENAGHTKPNTMSLRDQYLSYPFYNFTMAGTDNETDKFLWHAHITHMAHQSVHYSSYTPIWLSGTTDREKTAKFSDSYRKSTQRNGTLPYPFWYTVVHKIDLQPVEDSLNGLVQWGIRNDIEQ